MVDIANNKLFVTFSIYLKTFIATSAKLSTLSDLCHNHTWTGPSNPRADGSVHQGLHTCLVSKFGSRSWTLSSPVTVSNVFSCTCIERDTPVPANTRRWINAGLMLGRQRWANINPALVQCLVFPPMMLLYLNSNPNCLHFFNTFCPFEK